MFSLTSDSDTVVMHGEGCFFLLFTSSFFIHSVLFFVSRHCLQSSGGAKADRRILFSI